MRRPPRTQDWNEIGKGSDKGRTCVPTASNFGSFNPYVQRASYTIKERISRGDFCAQSESTCVPRPKTESRLKLLPSSGFSVHGFNAGDVRPRNDGRCPGRNSFCQICGVFPYSGRYPFRRKASHALVENFPAIAMPCQDHEPFTRTCSVFNGSSELNE